MIQLNQTNENNYSVIHNSIAPSKELCSKIVLSNLEAEGQGCGIIMGVTRLLLLEPSYYIALYWGL